MPVEIRLTRQDSSVTLAQIPSEISGVYSFATGEDTHVVFDMRSRPKRVVVEGLQDPVLRGRRDRSTRAIQLDFYGQGSTSLGGDASLEVSLGRVGLYRMKLYRRRELERRQAQAELIRRAATRVEPARGREKDLVDEYEVIDRSEHVLRATVAESSYQYMLVSIPRDRVYEPFPYPDDQQIDFEGNPLPPDKLRIRTRLPQDPEKRERFHSLVAEARGIQRAMPDSITAEIQAAIINHVGFRLSELAIF